MSEELDALRKYLLRTIVRNACELPGDDGIHEDEKLIMSINDLKALIENAFDEYVLARPLSAGEKDDWRPIHTAPKDGTRMLLYSKGHLVMLGGWAGHGSYGGPSWWSNNVPILPQPTKWQPLPDLPNGGSDEK